MSILVNNHAETLNNKWFKTMPKMLLYTFMDNQAWIKV
jgi:hypothetical protein